MTKIDQEELESRRHAVDFARVNNEFEGIYCTDQKYIDLNEQYARGEIELDAIGAYVDGLKNTWSKDDILDERARNNRIHILTGRRMLELQANPV